jgi:integrase
VTFKQCAEAFIASHEAGWGNSRHRQQWRNTLEQHVYPILGSLPVSEIDVALVMRARSKVRAVEHHAAVPYAEVATFMQALRRHDDIAVRAVEFLVLTAARLGEVLEATWAEVDLTGKVWIVPAARMKAGKEHRVPLANRALAIIEQMQSVQCSNYIFPGAREGRPWSSGTLLGRVKQIGGVAATLHGFRSSFRDWAAERTNFPREVAELALAHAIGSEVEAAYRRGDLFEKRRKLMDAWAEFCAKPSKSGTVVPIGVAMK